MSDSALSKWCLINLGEVLWERLMPAHVAAHELLFLVSLRVFYFWSSAFLGQPLHRLTISFTLRLHVTFMLTLSCIDNILSSSRLWRKRHHSCDSEEDQQLAHQAKRSATTPSLFVSDLDSEVFAFTWREILESWCFGAGVLFCFLSYLIISIF